MEKNRTHTLDLRGAIIPFTLLKVSLALKTLNVGDRVEILINDPDTHDDLLKVLPAASCDLVRMEEMEAGDSSIRMELIKKR